MHVSLILEKNREIDIRIYEADVFRNYTVNLGLSNAGLKTFRTAALDVHSLQRGNVLR